VETKLLPFFGGVCMNDSTLGVHLKVQSRGIGEKVEYLCVHVLWDLIFIYVMVAPNCASQPALSPFIICSFAFLVAAEPSYVITHTLNVEKQVLSLFKFHAHCARSYLDGFVNFTHQPSHQVYIWITISHFSIIFFFIIDTITMGVLNFFLARRLQAWIWSEWNLTK
jgi:hypothetical protein